MEVCRGLIICSPCEVKRRTSCLQQHSKDVLDESGFWFNKAARSEARWLYGGGARPQKEAASSSDGQAFLFNAVSAPCALANKSCEISHVLKLARCIVVTNMPIIAT